MKNGKLITDSAGIFLLKIAFCHLGRVESSKRGGRIGSTFGRRAVECREGIE